MAPPALRDQALLAALTEPPSGVSALRVTILGATRAFVQGGWCLHSCRSVVAVPSPAGKLTLLSDPRQPRLFCPEWGHALVVYSLA